MNYYGVTDTADITTLTTIKIILMTVLFANYFFKIQFIQETQLYLMIYLAFLLIVPPIIHHQRNKKRERFERPLRQNFVTAKDELDKAVKCAADSPEDAMIFLRGAIDASIKAKFGFTKISKMYHFISDAENFNLPLPSYTLIYTIYDQGNKRIHEGKIPTPFEASQAIELVTNFIAELQKIEISPDTIDEFKKKCNYVS